MKLTKERIAAEKADWIQVVRNGGPPCFCLEDGKFCLRAQRWEGHSDTKTEFPYHKFVSLADLLNAKQRECDDLTIRLAEEKLLVGSKDVEIERLRLACRLPLIFHGGGQWAWEQQNEWANIIKTLIPSSDNLEATTKNMCDAIRAAMTKREGKV